MDTDNSVVIGVVEEEGVVEEGIGEIYGDDREKKYCREEK